MVIIAFSENIDWYYANWVFRNLARAVANEFPDDYDLNYAFEEAAAIGILNFDFLEKDVASRVLSALIAVAGKAIFNGAESLEMDFDADQDSRRQYMGTMVELLEKAELVRAQRNAGT